MTLGAVSLGMVTNHGALLNNAIHAANASEFSSSNLLEKLTHVPRRILVKTPVSRSRNIGFLTRQERRLDPSSVVSAIPNENNEPDKTSLGAYADDQSSFISFESDRSSEEPAKEAVTSSIQLRPDHSQNAESQDSDGNLLDKLKAVQLHLLAMEQWNASRLKLCHRHYVVSATNLIHYLALKSLDVDKLKDDLSSIGLLNLETANPYVLASLSAGIQMLENLKSNFLSSTESIEGIIADKGFESKVKGKFIMQAMRKMVSSNRNLLLGPVQDKRTHIMVTVGQEAIESETLIGDLLRTGTTVIRINCAHGNPSTWSEIIRRVKRYSQMLEKRCRVLMDLAGPKLRTGKMKAGPCIMKLSPKKDFNGNVIAPAQVWLSPQGSGPPPAHISPDAVVYVDGQEFLSKLEIGDTVRFTDARGKRRKIKISKRFSIFSGVGFMADCTKTTYVRTGTELHAKGNKRKYSVGYVVDVPPVEKFIRLTVGDLLVISRDSSNELDEDEPTVSTVATSRVTCSSGYLFDSVKPGEPIAFDDGKIWGVIKGTSISEIIVSITHAGPRGTKLGSEKSINIPESDMRYEGLTSKDLVDLEFVATHADMVGISFVRDVCDIVVLRQELEKRKLGKLGVVLKIETKDGFENLPVMLLEAMKSPNPLGVMIARGDLAVECGWEKMAEIQEQILSICSAAHVPVVWATQVLESLVKSGVPTRAELTDVASGRRASCIMLNKGKHIVEAVSTLDAILKRSSTKVKAEIAPLALSNNLS